MLERLAHRIVRRRRAVIAVWVVLTLFGGFSASQVSKRWFQSFSIPGFSAYEANQATLKAFGSGEVAPMVGVFHVDGDITKEAGIARAVDAAGKINPRTRVSSYWSTHSLAYVSKDKHTAFAELYPPGDENFTISLHIKQVAAALKAATPPGVTSYLTGRDVIVFGESDGGGSGPSVLVEAMIGGLGALVILLFVFGTIPAVLMPIVVAIASILNTFTLVWILTYITDVSIIVEFLIALVGLGVAIDYALLMIFRFRDELREGEDVETAIVQTMTHAGRSVIVSGSTVAVGLLSMIVLPLPFIRSIGIGGMLIPAVSVIAAITLLPALLATLGTSINRGRVMPKRFVDGGHPEDGLWGRWANLVMRRPIPVAAFGLVLVGILVYSGVHLNPSEAQVSSLPGTGAAIQGRDALTKAGISPGVLKPLVILVQGKRTDGPGTAGGGVVADTVKALETTPGISGAAAPPTWQTPTTALVEAFPNVDSSSKAIRPIIDDLKDHVLPTIEQTYGHPLTTGAADPAADAGITVSLGGVAPEERDFVTAVYSNFPYVLAFVLLFTLILLARAFRSIILPLKAAVLNLVSLGAAYGIIVFIFQNGHGSNAIWGLEPTESIVPWIPLMIFAFLFGLSMDYEVFMLTRMREAYDETGDTNKAISIGLARTGKLVTSAALVLMFAFIVLSSSPGADIKEFGIGLAAGIIFDATIIRALLVPSLMRLLGKWNWWLPSFASKVLFVKPPAIEAAPVTDAA